MGVQQENTRMFRYTMHRLSITVDTFCQFCKWLVSTYKNILISGCALF